MNGDHGILISHIDDNLGKMLMIYGLIFGENRHFKKYNFTFPRQPVNDPSSAVDQLQLLLSSLSITTTAPLIDCHSLCCSTNILIGLGLGRGQDWPEAARNTGHPAEGRGKS